MLTLSNGNTFRVTGPLCGAFTGDRWIPLKKASDAELWCFLWTAPWINGWVNNREAGDLRRHRAYYDVIVMDFQDDMTHYSNGVSGVELILTKKFNMASWNVVVPSWNWISVDLLLIGPIWQDVILFIFKRWTNNERDGLLSTIFSKNNRHIRDYNGQASQIV